MVGDSGATGERDWGVFLPLYALHSERSWGSGDFGDMGRLADWTADLGGRTLATLPLFAAFWERTAEMPTATGKQAESVEGAVNASEIPERDLSVQLSGWMLMEAAHVTAASGDEDTAASGDDVTAASGDEDTAASGDDGTAASGDDGTAASGGEA